MTCDQHKDLNRKIWMAALLLFIAVVITIINYSGGCSVQKKGDGQQVFKAPGVAAPELSQAIPGYVSLDWAEDWMVADAQLLPNQTTRANTQYIVACDQYNQGISIDEIEQGINKGINMLSKNRFLKKVRRIKDKTGQPNPCVFAIDTRDYGLTASDRLLIEQSLQLQFVTQTIRGRVLQALLQVQKPYVFADDLMLSAFEADAVSDKKCGVYCTLLRQPLDEAAFFLDQGVNVQGQFDDEEALLAGFSTSQIALSKTRMVQILESKNGYCMTTYDVSLANLDSVFINPFPREATIAGGQIRSNRIFKHQAQEHICTLPNGIFGEWRLNGANGQAASFAPGDIVNDPGFAKYDPTIRLGSCSECHHPNVAQGFKDQVQGAILTKTGFSEDEKTLARVFFDDGKMQARLTEINGLQDQALAAIGVTASVDPLNENVIRPLRREQSASQVAAKVWLSTDDFLEALKGADKSSQALGNLLNGGTVSLGELKAAFPDLVREVNAYKDANL